MTNSQVQKYGAWWDHNDPIQIEMESIRLGGKWICSSGVECGLGLFDHYLNLQKLLWPHKKWHRWNLLLLKSFIENRIVGVLGCASSGKTKESADWALTNYFIWPHETTVMISSTDSRSLELRIWGEIKKAWILAKDVDETLAGHVIGSKQMITTDGKDAEARDFRNGIIGIPAVQNGTFVGIGKLVGIKNTRIIMVGDEMQFMSLSLFDSVANLNKNAGFQCIALGNPKDRMDPLGKIAEPCEEDGGWEGQEEPEKTTCWKTRFGGGIAVNLVGTDCPNFDVPRGTPPPFPFLITPEQIEEDEKFYGRDSLQFSMMNKGVMPKESVSRRVITRSMCEKFHAMDEPVWEGDKRTRIAGLDAAYGAVGGDRCMFMEMDFGPDRTGKQIIACIGNPVVVPVSVRNVGLPEDQIVIFVKAECERRGIPPENVFYDSTGRGTLMASFARLWSVAVNPVEFGGKATNRPVAADSTKTCYEHFSKFVSELWFAVRMAIEADQFRGLPEDAMNEGCMREWQLVSGGRVEIEPKEKTKLRMGRSPDIFDCVVTTLEGARRRGFQIAKLGGERRSRDLGWVKRLASNFGRTLKAKELTSV